MDKKSLPSALRARLAHLVKEAEGQVSVPSVRALTRLPPEAKKPRPRPTRPKSQEESFRDLDAFYEEAVAGMPDEALARAANVSLTSVLEWRKAKKIRRRKGWQRRRELAVWAADAFGDGHTPEIQETVSELRGQWDLPQYLLRTPINYDELCRSAYFLHTELGSGPDTIAAALGLRVRDVEMAIAVEAAHLERNGHSCERCGRPCDPAFGKMCSVRCRTETT